MHRSYVSSFLQCWQSCTTSCPLAFFQNEDLRHQKKVEKKEKKLERHLVQRKLLKSFAVQHKYFRMQKHLFPSVTFQNSFARFVNRKYRSLRNDKRIDKILCLGCTQMNKCMESHTIQCSCPLYPITRISLNVRSRLERVQSLNIVLYRDTKEHFRNRTRWHTMYCRGAYLCMCSWNRNENKKWWWLVKDKRNHTHCIFCVWLTSLANLK